MPRLTANRIGLLALLVLSSALSEAEAQQHSVDWFGADEGLPHLRVADLMQDARGFLWIGTRGGGVSRFDGYSFDSFDESSGLASNMVRSLYEHSDGSLFFSTDGGVSVYDGRDFVSFSVEETADAETYYAPVAAPLGAVWVPTSGGLIRIQRTSDGYRAAPEPALEGLHVTSALAGPGDSWIGTTDGLYHLAGAVFERSDLLSGLHVTALIRGADGANGPERRAAYIASDRRTRAP